MRKLISILLVVACVVCFASCRNNKNLPDEPVTTTPPASQQGGEVTDGTSENSGIENDQQGETENNFPVNPDNSVDPGVDLEEDILGTDDGAEPTDGIITPTATPKQAPATTDSGTQTTSTATATAAPTATATAAPSQPTATATAAPQQPTQSVIKLPMDKF